MNPLLIVAIVFFTLSGIGVGFTSCLADYLRRHQETDPIVKSITEMKEDLSKKLDELPQITKALNEISKKLDNTNR